MWQRSNELSLTLSPEISSPLTAGLGQLSVVGCLPAIALAQARQAGPSVNLWVINAVSNLIP